tara:strand:+ start:336 stop:515 length:180 start_codon:yes stop_codon:yes gene_type:complete
MKILEGLHCGWRSTSRLVLEQMTRVQLIEWLEFRGMACYDDESTELLRETAIEDYDGES